MRSARAIIRDSALGARRLIPMAAVPALVHRKAERLWNDAAFRQNCIDQMTFLLDASPRADEIPDLARGYAEEMVLRNHLRWHPRAITKMEVRGGEWLTTERDPSRPMMVSFMHHARYDAIWGSLHRALGVWHTGIMTPEWLEPDAPIEFRQHAKVCALGATLVPSNGGPKAMIDQFLQPGSRFVVAPDIPGKNKVTFLGKEVLGSAGSARMARMTDAALVVVTSHRDGDDVYVQVHEPLQPSEFADADALNQAALDIHAVAVLDWPEALEAPTARFGRVA